MKVLVIWYSVEIPVFVNAYSPIHTIRLLYNHRQTHEELYFLITEFNYVLYMYVYSITQKKTNKQKTHIITQVERTTQ